MKVYTHIVMDMTQEHVPIIEEESFSYDGKVSLCSGGGGQEGAPDWYYDRKMDVAERQMDISEQKHDFWKQHEKPLEKQKLEANEELLPQMTDLKETQIGLEQEKAGFQSDKLDVKQEGLGLQSDTISKKKEIMDDMGGLGIDNRMNQAEADVTQEFQQNQEEAKRSMSRMGVDPTSGKFQDMEQDMAIEKASAEAGARNQARTKSKQMGFGLMGG